MDIASLRTDVADLATAIRGASSEKSEDLKSTVQENIRVTRERVRARMEEARAKSKEAMSGMEDTIGDHPIGSIATAVGVGFLIAKLMDLGTHR
jgi:ElaB/YqjD/DUF883 family membrane-anchored ribosome-binding protein